MSESGQFIRKIENELIAVGDGITRQWPLLVAGKPVRNVRGKPTIYREDWQGRVELSSEARTNQVIDSGDLDSNNWTSTNSITATQSPNLAPNGIDYATRLVINGTGRPNWKTAGNVYEAGVQICASVFARRDQTPCLCIYGGGLGLPGIGFDLAAATATNYSWDDCGVDVISDEWVRVWGTFTPASATEFEFVLADGVSSYPIPANGSILDVWGASVIPSVSSPGAYIPTTNSPVTVTDYTYTAPTATVLLPEPLPPGAKLYWSGELVFDADPSLLPSSAIHGVRVIESATTSMAGMATPLRQLWNPYTCPLELLPWLAWALSIDSWKSYWPESVKRERVARAIAIQRHKGTAQSVRAVIQSFGGAVQLREWWQRTPPGDPHTFDLILTLADAQGEAATAQYVDDVIAEVKRTKPVRSHFTFTQGITARAKVGVASVARPVVYRRLNFEAPAA